MKSKIFLISFILLFCSNFTYSQFIEDALRFSLPSKGLGARAIGLGNAFTGIADDYSATFWNPAGLAQINKFELTGGLYFLSYNNDATFFGNTTNYSNSSSALNNIGFVFPFPTYRGSLVFAVGYNRTNDLTTARSFDGFNSNSSIVPSIMNDYEYSVSLSESKAGKAPWLWYEDTLGLFTPIEKNVNQSGKTLEDGNLGNWTFSGAMEVAPNLFVGLSLYVLSGKYSYDQSFVETDTRDYYFATPKNNFDFKSLDFRTKIIGDYSGFGANLGLLYKIKDIAKVGLSIKTPFTYTIKEDYSTNITSYFDNGDIFGPIDLNQALPDYTVITPMEITGGISVTMYDFLLSGDFDWIDYSQLKFENAATSILDRNSDIKDFFRSVINFRFGAEYTIPQIDLKVRGGYSYNPSAYIGDNSDFADKRISFGLGYMLENNLMIDAAYVISKFKTMHNNYDSSSRTTEEISLKDFLMTFSFRF
jgi:long-subunit fatty acid transport protein